jgi:hypothetical protein
MSNPQAIVNLRPPSEAYREATRSLVYRLSELMFGSLLAAYSLGFVGAIAAHGSQLSTHGPWGVVLLSFQYASISIAFAYLTTSFYLTYHAGILTMPQMAFEHLASDFTLAIVQAVFFGVSILQPALFPILLGVNFHISGKRKDKEYEELALRLYNEICGLRGRNEPDHLPLFSESLKKLLKQNNFRQLSGWAPMGPDLRKGTRKAIIVGVIVIALYILLEFLTWILARQNSLWFGISLLEVKWILQQLLITFEVVWATVIIKKVGSQVVKRRASFLGFPIMNPDHHEPKQGASDHLKPYVEKGHMNKTGDRPVETKDVANDQEARPEMQKRSPMDEEFVRLQSELRELCQKLVNAS